MTIDQHTRRGLLLGAGAAAAMAQTAPQGIGFIGLGNRSSKHLDALTKLPEARITALSDVESAKMTAANANLSTKAATYTDYRELLRDRNVGVVVIATPNHLHHEMALAALRAGKDVLLEKPIATNYQHAREIQREAEKQGRILGVGMQRAFRSDAEIHDAVKRGDVGTVRLINAGEYRRDWFPGGWIYTDPKSGKSANWRFLKGAIGSSELEFSVHMYGTLTRIIDSKLVWLSATGADLVFKGRDIRDGSHTIAEFANGIRLAHTYGMFAPQTPYIVILGDKGSLRRDGAKLQLFGSDGKPRALPPAAHAAGEDEVLMYRDFFEAVKTRRPPKVGAGLAIEAGKIAWGLEISITEKRAVTGRDFAD
ncbi:MAG: Gfo/Idh/MocA family oxidoreductase [Acidobacteria bacterium]|nr:Gfo/Idh/MocA family oxidoreductase [Acidobacteriota bacterium]